MGDLQAETIEEAYQLLKSVFKERGLSTPDLDAAILLEGATGATTLIRMTHPEQKISGAQQDQLNNYMHRRLQNAPVHRIIGHREFYGLKLQLNEATLVPRPDTEMLVDTVLPFVHETCRTTGTCKILDLGTGSGAIALAILGQEPEAIAVATDLSSKALEMASENANMLGLQDRFEPAQSNWFENVVGAFDLIVSNPPYIRHKDIDQLDPDVKDFDPMLALDGGADGLNAYGIIAAKAQSFLKKSGRIALEIGFDQRLSVSTLFQAAGFELLEARQDLNGQDRVIFLRQ